MICAITKRRTPNDRLHPPCDVARETPHVAATWIHEPGTPRKHAFAHGFAPTFPSCGVRPPKPRTHRDVRVQSAATGPEADCVGQRKSRKRAERGTLGREEGGVVSTNEETCTFLERAKGHGASFTTSVGTYCSFCHNRIYNKYFDGDDPSKGPRYATSLGQQT
jgi:hypothetical protein